MATAPSPRDQRRFLREQARFQRNSLRAQRRGSILAPLLLLLVGLILLLIQLGRISAVAALDVFGRFWPLVLILAGVVRLVEWFLDRRRQTNALAQGQTYYPRSTGFAVASLLILLTLGGIAAMFIRQHGPGAFGRDHDLLLNSDNLQEFFGNKHESDQSQTVPCPDGTTLTVQNPRGDISIAGTSTDGQLHLSSHEEVYSSSDTEAARLTERLIPRLDHSDGALNLSLPSLASGRADLTITVPSGTTVVATADHGDLRIDSMHAPVTATANHGDLELSTIEGSAVAHVNQGDSSFSAHNVTGPLTLEGRGLDATLSDIGGPVSINGDFFGTVHLERSRSKVHLHTSRIDLQFGRLDGELEASENSDLTADQIIGPVILNTRNRNISLERVSGDVSLTNRNGSVTLSVVSPIGSISVENRNGGIDFSVPQNAGFVLDAETTNADLTNDLGLASHTDGNHTLLSGTVGQGGPTVRLVTSQADVAIHRADLAPITPVPPAAPSASQQKPLTKKPARDHTDVQKTFE